MKMMIEVRGGVIQNIAATEEISIHIVDHDNLGDSDGIGREELIEDTRQAQQPDLITHGDDERFQTTLNETLQEYEG
tara:strand:- start:193 stop:423 length:231 start_codon:yes stop_codon:yes gene_type:complete